MTPSLLFTLFLSMVSNAFAANCVPGKVHGYETPAELVAYVKRTEDRTYMEREARFIKGVRAAQIRKAFETDSVKVAFTLADEGMIHKFEIMGNERTSYDFLTVVYALVGDEIMGAIFTDDSSAVMAWFYEDQILVCE